MMEEITSRKNPLISHLRKLIADRDYRRERELFFCEGPKMLSEALRWGVIPELVMCSEQEILPALPASVRLVKVPEDLLKAVAATEKPQKLIFTCRMKGLFPPERVEAGHYLVLDGLQDPGNLGTIWRTADAFGADGIFLVNHCVDLYSPKVIRATMGAVFRLPAWETTLQKVKELMDRSEIPLIATALRDDTTDLREISHKPMAVVIGSEGRGVSEEAQALCRKTIRIPMRERCESLNAAVAASVVLWEMFRS